MPGVEDFKLSITKALGDQLAEAFLGLTPISLSHSHLTASVVNRGGVYQLYLDNKLVYIGKADHKLQQRLLKHLKKIGGRENLDLNRLSFTAIYVDEDMSAVAPETLLIQRHRSTGDAIWNFNGFGNNDPGRQRDTSSVAQDHFDSLYPINLQCPVSTSTGRMLVGDFLAKLKKTLPFTFRYQYAKSWRTSGRVEFSPMIDVPTGLTATTAFELAAAAVPAWQLTALPGYTIFYNETRPYAHAQRIF